MSLQVQKTKAQQLFEILRRLDSGELDREGVRRFVEAIDAVDEAYANGNTSGLEVESSTEFMLTVKKMPGEPLWLVLVHNDVSNYRVGEAIVEDDMLLVRNFSESPQTEETILIENPDVAGTFRRVMELGGDEKYDCIDFWAKNVKTEAFKCIDNNTTMYLIVAPKIVYIVRDKITVVKNEDVTKAFHVLLNVPL